MDECNTDLVRDLLPNVPITEKMWDVYKQSDFYDSVEEKVERGVIINDTSIVPEGEVVEFIPKEGRYSPGNIDRPRPGGSADSWKKLLPEDYSF